jgi:hypothetical protein
MNNLEIFRSVKGSRETLPGPLYLTKMELNPYIRVLYLDAIIHIKFPREYL